MFCIAVGEMQYVSKLYANVSYDYHHWNRAKDPTDHSKRKSEYKM